MNNFKNKFRLLFVVIVWFMVTGLLYTGILEMELIGHIEISAVVGFSIILLGLHLFTIIKKEVNHTLHF